ncbi:aspartyl-phosphate phosphatase Spo0E family protein [Paenibacillus oenotherae]|uniref:Aspartyl-phosphate phosphatase Spo0E family protein n=1 Tax=Paenibacillus oenotherae TaxID=1435645 RepID=A0ABS7D4R1_9BACL|nr:aspartyl-phosphate phosphatase Spo0E family protein [Paenibacillus oenotherae]
MTVAYADNGRTSREEPNTISAKQLSSSIRILEDEIHTLRIKMEQSYMEEASFSSDIVIDLSRKLDVKINEYMNYMHRKTKSEYSDA